MQKQMVESKIYSLLADVSFKLTKKNVNSVCWFYQNQPKLPVNHEKLKEK